MEIKNPSKELKVALDFGEGDDISIGRLVIRNNKIFFEYDPLFSQSGLEISPYFLPVKNQFHSFDPFLFEGVAGVFNDSLPDGWGRLLFDRELRSRGIHPSSISVLDRLAYIGKSAIGALTYEPPYNKEDNDFNEPLNLDELLMRTQELLQGNSEKVITNLLTLNGSSAGARPKALIGISENKSQIISGVDKLDGNYQHWIVKFPNSTDDTDTGAIEYVYSQMAKLAGVEMTESHLFPSAKGAGHFATKRFDRNQKKRLHIHSACGMMHSNFRTPSLDYRDLIKVTLDLTKQQSQVLKMYRLAVFNVLSHNRDDHSKNFSFLMNQKGEWSMAPAYDLTYSFGLKGEQSTMVMGEGKNPGTKDLIKLGKIADIKEKQAKEIIEQTQEALSNWSTLAKNADISKPNIQMIAKQLEN